MALAITKAFIKVGTVAAVVYYSIHKGVWSTSSESAAAYEDLKTYVVPQVSDAIEKLPYEVQMKWNECVKSSFSRIESISKKDLHESFEEALKKTRIRAE